MRRLIVNFDCHSVSAVFQHEVGIAAVLIDVIEVILRIEVPRFLCTEGLAE